MKYLSRTLLGLALLMAIMPPAQADPITMTFSLFGQSVTNVDTSTTLTTSVIFNITANTSTLTGPGLFGTTNTYPTFLSILVTMPSFGVSNATEVGLSALSWGGISGDGFPDAIVIGNAANTQGRGFYLMPGIDSWNGLTDISVSTNQTGIGSGGPLAFQANGVNFSIPFSASFGGGAFSAIVTAVPEPATIGLLSAVGIGIGYLSWKKRNATLTALGSRLSR